MWGVVLLLTSLAFKASASQIKGFGDTTADYGGEARFKCDLDDHEDALQVTWQRLYEDNSIETLATYSARFGEQVNDPYRGKITITEASLRSTAITVRNLTWTDESCYMCSFNTYPGGSKRHQTCLQVQGVSEAKIQVIKPPDDDTKEKNKNVKLRCVATGKPRPQLRWDCPQCERFVEESETSATTSSDHTFTSSSDITLQLTPGWDGQVDCVINSGTRGEQRETMAFKGNKTKRGHVIAPIIVAVVALPMIMIVLFLFFRNRLRPPLSCEGNPL